MTQTADAVVIGTGVIGAAVAYELAQTGLRVVAIDRLGGVGSGSTRSSNGTGAAGCRLTTTVHIASESAMR